jgi:uncharacterized repeat protein (TIGR02543 family)
MRCLPQDPSGTVSCDAFDRCTLFFTELFKESPQHFLAMSLMYPYDAVGVMVNDDGDVLVAFLIARLIDADVLQTIETVLKADDTLVEPSIPTSNNDAAAKFIGWYEKGATTPQVFGKVPNYSQYTKDTTIQLYANYAREYHVIFHDQNNNIYTEKVGNTGDSIQTIASVVSITTLGNEAFTGWSMVKAEAGVTQPGLTKEDIISNKDVDLYPIIKSAYWITFESNGGSYIDPVYVLEGEDTKEPEKPTKTGFTFSGWYIDEGLTTPYKFGETIQDKLELYAKWTGTSVNYTIIYWQENANDTNSSFKESVINSGTAGDTTSFTSTSTDNIINTNDKVIKDYDGFTVKSIENTTIKGDGSSIVNIYYSRNIYSIKFNKYNEWTREWQEDTSLTITAKYGADIASSWPTKTSKMWGTSYDKDKATAPFQSGIDTMPLKGDEFYYVRSSGKYTMNLYYYVQVLNGETGTETYEGNSYKLDHTDSFKTYNPDDWITSSEDHYNIKGFTYTNNLPDDSSFSYESWHKYSVTFYYNRNSYDINCINYGVKTSTSYQYEQTISTPADPVRPSSLADVYSFYGWYDNEECLGNEYSFPSKMPADNITVYAKWAAPDHTVSFDLNGASGQIGPITAHYGTAIERPSDPKRDGYTFSNWYKPDGTVFSFDSKIYSDITLTAKWISNSAFTVLYKNSGKAAPSDLNVYVDSSKAIVKESAASDSKYFSGWELLDASGNSTGLIYHPGDILEINSEYADANNEIVLQAIYNPVPAKVTITYDANNGTGKTFTTDPYPNNSSFVLKTYWDIKDFTSYSGYYFNGWNTSADGKGTSYHAGDTVGVNNLADNVLYAEWLPKAKLTITGASDSKVYTGSEQEITDFTTTSLVGGAELSGVTYSAKGTNVGTYDGAFSGTPVIKVGDVDVTEHYTITITLGTLTITKASADLNKVTATDYSGTYDASAHTITASAAQTGSTLYYSKTGGAEATDWSTTAPTWTDVTAAQTVYVKATNPNYEDAFGQATVTITQKAVTVTANDKSKIYGADDPALDAKVDGTLGTDTVAYTLSRAAGEDVGTYTITPSGEASQGNYSVTYATGTLEITKASADLNKVTATDYSGTYDASAHTITASAAQTGSTLYYSKTGGAEAKDWSTEAPTWTDVTAAQTVYVKATNPNYEDAFGQATVTITQKAVTVTANDKSKIYGADDPALDAKVDGTLGTDTVAYTLSRAAGEDVGTYTITPSGEASQGNYSVTYATGTLEITKASADLNKVTATDYSGTYDASAHTITASAAQTGSTLYYSKTGGAEAKDWSTEAPTWTDVTAAQTVYVKATNPNYEDAFGQATVTITQKAVTVTANDKSKIYGADDPALDAKVDGTLGTDTVAYTLSRAAGEDVGTYTITPSGEASQGNYSVTYATGTLEITKASADLNKVTATDYSGTYDASAHTITASAAQTGSTLYYSKTGGAEAKDWSTEAPTWTDVTAAQTVYVKATNPNYEDAFGQATVTITQKAVTVTANDKSKIYGADDPALDAKVDGTLGTDTVAYTLSRAAGEDVGTYTITPSGEASQGNYSVTYATGTLEITKASADLNKVTATDYSGTYDASAHTITASAAQTGSTLYYSKTGGAEAKDWSTEAPTWTDVTAAQTVYVKATNPNYEDAFGQATVTITQKAVTVTANDKSKIYGADDPALDAKVDGTLGTDTVAYTLSRAAGEDVGTYTITPSGEASQGNYSVTYATGTLEITKASADLNKVTATDYSGTYDASAHTITASAAQTGSTLYYSKTGGAEAKDWSTEAPTWTDVTAAQTVYVKATNPNYEDAFGQATVTITQKAVTVTANDKSKIYGADDPALDAKVDGTLGTDTVAYTLSRAAGEDVGTYTITPSGEASQGNYSVTYATGTLEITKASADLNKVTATDYSGTYDASAHTITASAAQTGSTLYYSKTGGAEAKDWSTEAPTWTDVTAAQTVYVKATNPNYEDAFGQATVTITQKAVTVTANDKSKIYGADDPALDAKVDGTLGTDTVAYTLSRAAGEDVGTYTITPSGEASQGNYSVTYATGTLEITKASADLNKVTATDYSGTYDASAHTITASAAQTGSTLYYSKTGGAEAKDWSTEAPTWTDVTAAQTVYVKAVNQNYEDAFGQATVTITQKAVTVTANDKSKIYGADDPALDAKVDGTLGTDTVAYTLSRAAGEDVGTYAITPAGNVSQGNYSVTYVPGKFNIIKATENAVNATPYVGTYDAAAHGITASAVQTGSTLYYSKTGGAEAKDWSTEAPTWTDVTAAQTVYVKATNPNYEDAFDDAAVTINPKQLTITGESASRTYTGSNQSVTGITYDGLLGGHTASGMSYSANGTDVGTYNGSFSGTVVLMDITSKDVTGNYNITYVPGTLTIASAGGGDQGGDTTETTVTPVTTPTPVGQVLGATRLPDVPAPVQETKAGSVLGAIRTV